MNIGRKIREGKKKSTAILCVLVLIGGMRAWADTPLSNQATDTSSIAIGKDIKVPSNLMYSVILGNAAKPSNIDRQVLIGYEASTEKEGTAVGNMAGATGNFSTAIGSQAKSEGIYSTAIGYNVQARKESSIAIGGGEVSAKAEGMGSIAFGARAETDDNYSLAVGVGASAKKLNSSAIGYYAKADGLFSMALGDNSNATKMYSLAVGANSSAGLAKSVAIGHYSKTGDSFSERQTSITLDGTTYTFAGTPSSNNGVFSIGDTDKERVLINVAPGQISESSTDAINGSQLHATNQALENLSGQAVKYDVKDGNVDYTHITLAEGGTTISNVADTAIEEGSMNAVNGGSVYRETRVSRDGTYIRKENTAARNLEALDRQVSSNTSSIY